MDIFNINEAKAQFSKLMRRVEQGQEVLVARNGVVIARIVPASVRSQIKLGRDEGTGIIHANFDAPLAEFAEYMG